jgi:hypothetical protein
MNVRTRCAVVSALLLLPAGFVGAQVASQDEMPFGAIGALNAGGVPAIAPLTTARGGAGAKPGTAAGWRIKAQSLVESERFAEAASAFQEASRCYRQLGDINTARVMTVYAQRYETRLTLLTRREAPNASTSYTGKRLEPRSGCYLGAFIDREDKVDESYTGLNGQIHRDSDAFNRVTGRHHAIFLTYQQYGRPFPEEWMQHLKENGAAAQWALQPRSLDEIQDNDYLQGLAEEAGRVGTPIFLRFAAEMNGAWTPYHNNPGLYREKFQLVARVFHRYAPNVAMVWCPNEIPEANITAYYPGPEAVDWVGVNFYSVPYADNDPARPVSWRNPGDCLDYIYRTYSARHPILIGEYAASHYSTASRQDFGGLAARKITQLYSALPLRYPRVKAVHYFSMNATLYAPPSRRMNNYSVLDHSAVAAAYRRAIQSPYFLSRVQTGATAPVTYTPLTNSAALRGTVNLVADVKTYAEAPRVALTVNGKTLPPSSDNGQYCWTVDAKTLTGPTAQLALTVRDSAGRVAGTTRTVASLGEGIKIPLAQTPTTPSAQKPTPPPALLAPVILKPPAKMVASKNTTLADLLMGALTDSRKLTLAATPGEERQPARTPFRFTLRAGSSGYALLLVLTEGKAHLVSQSVTDAIELAWMDAGGSVGIPRAESHVLRPGKAGAYTIRALLFTDREAALAFVKAYQQTDGDLNSAQGKAQLRALRVPHSSVYRVDRYITIL